MVLDRRSFLQAACMSARALCTSPGLCCYCRPAAQLPRCLLLCTAMGGLGCCWCPAYQHCRSNPQLIGKCDWYVGYAAHTLTDLQLWWSGDVHTVQRVTKQEDSFGGCSTRHTWLQWLTGRQVSVCTYVCMCPWVYETWSKHAPASSQQYPCCSTGAGCLGHITRRWLALVHCQCVVCRRVCWLAAGMYAWESPAGNKTASTSCLPATAANGGSPVVCWWNWCMVILPQLGASLLLLLCRLGLGLHSRNPRAQRVNDPGLSLPLSLPTGGAPVAAWTAYLHVGVSHMVLAVLLRTAHVY
jgi:hypothetical protein